jgi:membrane associated rhomboid family serine protease
MMPRYRQVAYSFGPPLTPVVKQLIIITTAAFAVTYIPQQILGWSAPYAWFALQPNDVLHRFYVWELASYMFLHWGFFHICALDVRVGPREFVGPPEVPFLLLPNWDRGWDL